LPRLIKTLILICIAVAVCILGTFVVIDTRCSSDIARWIPLYPNAQIVEEDYNFRRRATGITSMLLWTADEPDAVRRWYFRQRSAEADKDPNRGLATTNFTVQTDFERGGSVIYLYSRCGQ
jgi:hypothetical protein